MRSIRTTTISILIVGLLAGSAVGTAAQDEDAAAGAPEPLPAGTGPLAPGTYADSSLGHTVTLTVGEGWSIGGESLEGVGVDLVPEPFDYGGPEGVGFVGMTIVNHDGLRSIGILAVIGIIACLAGALLTLPLLLALGESLKNRKNS